MRKLVGVLVQDDDGKITLEDPPNGSLGSIWSEIEALRDLIDKNMLTIAKPRLSAVMSGNNYVQVIRESISPKKDKKVKK